MATTECDKSGNAKLCIAGNVVPIPILPFPSYSGISFTSNVLEVKNKMYFKDVYKTYNHKGTYIASSSSSLDYKYLPYNAFNYKSASGWISGIDGNSNISIYYDSNDTTVNTKSKYALLHNGPSFYNSNTETVIQQQPISFSTLGSSSTKVKGEWLQIQLPTDKPIYLFRYRIKVPPPTVNLFQVNNEKLDKTYPRDEKFKPNYVPNYAKNPLKDYKPHYLNTNEYTNTISPFPTNYNELIPDHVPRKYTSHFPKVFVVAGSNDGKNWYYVDQHSFVDPPDVKLDKPNAVPGDKPNFKQGYEVDYENNTISFEVNSINRYCYFRLIISELFPGNMYAQISEWHLYAFVANVTPNALSQFSDVPYSYGKISENFTINSPYNLMEINEGNRGELDKIYNDQVSEFVKAKNNNDKKMIEGFDVNAVNNYGYSQLTQGNNPINPNDVVNQQIIPLSKMYGDFIGAERNINNNYIALKKNIVDFSNNYFTALNDPNDKYDLGKSTFNRQPTKEDGWLLDNRELVLNQNSTYILCTITTATLIIALFMTYNR